MKRQEAVNATLSPQQLEHLWAEHIKGEFESKDVEATLATMVEDAYVNHMPVNTGGRGKEALRAFSRDDFIPSWPDVLQMTPWTREAARGNLLMNCTSRSPTVSPCPGFCQISPQRIKKSPWILSSWCSFAVTNS